jgi:GntR family transcriptional repressor for pyruvate dehydrogenase complex
MSEREKNSPKRRSAAAGAAPSQTASGAGKLYRIVIDTLQQEIADGIFPPGSRLPPERALVERFSVSRLTIREALIGMEILGLVEARQGSGFYVIGATARPQAQPNALDIGAFELTEARRIIEVQAAALAALAATDEQIAEMDRILQAMELENHEPRQNDWAADRRFHMEIARATQNDAIVLMIEMLWDVRTRSPLCHAMLQRITAAGGTPRMTDHRLILDGIKARNPAAARDAMLGHLDRVLGDLLVFTENDAIEKLAAANAQKRAAANRRLIV